MEEREKAIDRIRKLLARSTSSNPHEASLAAAIAAKIMARHGIESISDVEEDDPVSPNTDLYVRIGSGKRIPGWKWQLAHAVALSGNCKPLPLHEIVNGKIVNAHISFIGRRSDAEICTFLFGHLHEDLQRLRRARMPPVGHRLQIYIPGQPPSLVDRDYQRKWTKDFYMGAVSVLYERMAKAREEVMVEAESTALVFVDQVRAKVDAVIQDLGITYVNQKGSNVHSATGFQEGQLAGSQVEIHRPGGNGGNLALPSKKTT